VVILNQIRIITFTNKIDYIKRLFVSQLSSALFAVSMFISCTSAGEKAGDTTASKDSITTHQVTIDEFKKGQVIDSIRCTSDGAQYFALYLPTNYSPNLNFPCIVLFDAHARGVLPLNKYKDLAEKYGYILLASDNSKNGLSPEVTGKYAAALLAEARTRFNTDPARVYTAGFSGGSRVAGDVAMKDGNVSGVIGCSAGFSGNGQGGSKFDYVGFAGEQDFNLLEMEALDQQLQAHGFVHQLFTFPGIHGWPPAENLEMAMLWLQVNAMKARKQPKTDDVVDLLKSLYNKQITSAEKAKDIIAQEQLLSGMVSVLNSLSDVSSEEKKLATLQQSAEYKKAIANEGALQQQELAGQQELAKEIAAHDDKWWADKIASMKKEISSSPVVVARMKQRLLNYLGLVCYLYADGVIKQGDARSSGHYLNVFQMVDPANPDVSYLKAIQCMKLQDVQGTLIALNKAVDLAYNNVADILSEEMFAPLHSDPKFAAIVKRMNQNLSGK